MKRLRFSIDIDAPREKVWKVLWEDATFRDWADIVDKGSYAVGDWKEGGKIQFLSSVTGYGVLSMIKKLVPNEYVSFEQLADIKDGKEQPFDDKAKEWAGGSESYSLKENAGVTTISVEIDVPDEHKDEFENKFPKALERVKVLAEES